MADQVEGVPVQCSKCGAALCLRKQVINLALGNVEVVYCLDCLSAIEQETPQKLVSGLAGYIMGRDCFRKEWVRYKGVEDCPSPSTCIPETCFNKSND
ncbi:MAG: hypothetical protein U0103_30225 [Candidatus Obscuribacterales bacterium]